MPLLLLSPESPSPNTSNLETDALLMRTVPLAAALTSRDRSPLTSASPRSTAQTFPKQFNEPMKSNAPHSLAKREFVLAVNLRCTKSPNLSKQRPRLPAFCALNNWKDQIYIYKYSNKDFPMQSPKPHFI